MDILSNAFIVFFPCKPDSFTDVTPIFTTKEIGGAEKLRDIVSK